MGQNGMGGGLQVKISSLVNTRDLQFECASLS